MLKLKDIFTLDLNTRGGVKLFNKIANKYNLHKEDRKDLMNVEVGSSEGDNGFKYKSNKICWEINPLTDEQTNHAISLLSEMSIAPFYSAIYIAYDGNYSNHVKYYGYQTQFAISRFCANVEPNALYLEESSSNIIFNYNGEIIENLSFSNFIKVFEQFGFTEDAIYEMAGIKRITYEEYINRRVDKEIGKELVNE